MSRQQTLYNGRSETEIATLIGEVFMKRLLWIASSLVLLVVIAGCAFETTAKTTPRKKLNILFIAVDDLRPELGCYGNTIVKSPHIDRLAEQGMTFTRAYCQTALCNPSRTSLMTGLYPNSTKVWTNAESFREIAPDTVTLAQHFKQNGYHSLAIGKIYHNVIPDPMSWSEPKMYLPGFPFDPDAGYAGKENTEILEQKKQELIAAGRSRTDRFGQWYIKAKAVDMPDVPDNAYYDGAQADAAIEKLRELSMQDKPFFYAVGFYKPHLPFCAPKKYWDLYDRNSIPLPPNPFVPENAPDFANCGNTEIRSYDDFTHTPYPYDSPLSDEETRLLRHGYFACVSYIDAQIGRLMDTLETLGLRDNTIVVLWGDHGWKLGEHAGWAKQTDYEIDARVPWIISVPGAANQGARCNQLVEFVDMYPTLCDLAGIPIPKNLDGVSIAPLIKNPDKPVNRYAFTQLIRERVFSKNDAHADIPYMGYSVRSDRYRYVEWMNLATKSIEAAELYDHVNDPLENKNIAADPELADVVKEHAAALKPGWDIFREKYVFQPKKTRTRPPNPKTP